MANSKPPPTEAEKTPGERDQVIFLDTGEPGPGRETQSIVASSDGDTDQAGTPTVAGPAHRLRLSGVDILSGPARGKRIYFTGKETALGVGNTIAVIIRSVGAAYTAERSDQSFTVSVNENRVEHHAVELNNGDQIFVSDVTARFFVETESG